MSRRRTLANKRASSSRDDPPPPLSQVPLRRWFSKKEHWTAFRDKYSKMLIIKPRYLAEGLLPEDNYLDFWRLLDFQGLRPLLFLKERYYPRLMAAVTTTIRTNDTLDKDVNGVFQLEFHLAGVKHTLGLEKFAAVSGLQNEVVLFRGGNNPPKRLKYADGKEAQERLLVSPLSGGKYSVRRMSTDHRLLQYMLSYVWLPRKRNHEVVTEEDLIILWAMVTKTKLNWAYLIARHLRGYGYGPVEAGLGHSMLWTKIFEHLGIDLSGDHAMLVASPVFQKCEPSVILANPTGPVYIPDHYRTHFPEDNISNALNVYVPFSFIYLGVSVSYTLIPPKQAETLARRLLAW
ncbi:hypothetical protein PIB30_026394 [Stylosanthes scabra]|uniref:Uncharacterized protein n=1 Tax=Stylosanthes scabra TaxID=79078 RepID=A0ABU6RAV1_9FABA|nr:hypothetical protein [Stylosanthes scabra]